jgi:glycerate kinase
MGHLLAAFDKFRGSASAAELGQAAMAAARQRGWSATSIPMSDGGEGLLDCLEGEPQRSRVTGPLALPVEATWSLIPPAHPGEPTMAIVEMARASGLELAGGAEGNDPEAATTKGTGELILAAARAGANRIIVGCGGSATTDGGAGAVEVLAGRPELAGVELLVACDVTTPFLDAARVFAPQKAADPACVARLEARLGRLAATYRAKFGIDVTHLEGAGAAGGLAGGLAALGGRLVSGFELVADLVDLDRAIAAASVVVTGEGRLDDSSLAGKVVGGLLGRSQGRLLLLVVGAAEPATASKLAKTKTVRLVILSERYGADASLARPASLVEDVVASYLAELEPACTSSGPRTKSALFRAPRSAAPPPQA